MLLVISGVELNSGPVKLEDVVSTKLDDVVRDLITQLHTCEATVSSHAARPDQKEKAQTTIATELATLQTSVMSLGHTSASVPTTSNISPVAAASSSFLVDDVVRELDVCASKKVNIILSGVCRHLHSLTSG